ncbi:hypothetical protein RCO48_17355 [Peribacillus frigoritolerans]|nr:hypothetical protein [Peribacillus frigoritolerans]
MARETQLLKNATLALQLFHYRGIRTGTSKSDVPVFIKQKDYLTKPTFYRDETLIGWKKFATLLPKYWLVETPQTLASRRLGRQSAERGAGF